jgi:hypothetical protein
VEVRAYYADVVSDRDGDRVKYSEVGRWAGAPRRTRGV